MSVVFAFIVAGLIVAACFWVSRQVRQRAAELQRRRVQHLAWNAVRQVDDVAQQATSALMDAVVQQQWRDRGRG